MRVEATPSAALPLRPVAGRDWHDEKGRVHRRGYRRAFVRRDPDPETTAGGVVIPIVKRKHATQATVVAVHPDERELRVGQRVLLGQYAGTDFRFGGELLTSVPVDDVLAVLEDEFEGDP